MVGKTQTAAVPVSHDAAPQGALAMHEQVYEGLKQSLISGRLEPGRALSVRGLAADYGVSAMPAREAIRRLAAIGALEVTETRRVAVARMTPAKFTELNIARLAVEPSLAALALDRGAREQRAREALAARLKKMDDALDAAIASGDVGEYARLNSEFHFALYAAAEAPTLMAIAESLWLQTGPFMRIVTGRIGTSSLIDQHKEAIDALRAGDAEKLAAAIRLDIAEGMNHIGRDVAAAAQATRSVQRLSRR